MRASRQNPFLLTIAAISVSCSSAPSALRVGVEKDVPDAEAVQERSSVGAANPATPELAAPSAGRSQGWEELHVAINSGDASNAISVCSGECLDVQAEIQGGNPPYLIVWDDDSTHKERRVCPQVDGMLSVRVTDTALDSVEFPYAAQQTSSQLLFTVKDCPLASADAGLTPPVAAGSCSLTQPAPCSVAPGVSLPEDVTVDIPGATARPFAGGAALPAGRYRIEYVDGCNTFGVGCDWTVHGSKNQPGAMSCFLVANGSTVLHLTPGTSGVFANTDPDIGGAFATYAECVAANCKEAPLDFDFAGGILSVQRDGGGVLGAVDDAGGESMGGRSPTFRLSRLDECD